MTIQKQIVHFATDLENMINRYAMEYDLPLAAVIGTLEIQKQVLINNESEDDQGF